MARAVGRKPLVRRRVQVGQAAALAMQMLQMLQRWHERKGAEEVETKRSASIINRGEISHDDYGSGVDSTATKNWKGTRKGN